MVNLKKYPSVLVIAGSDSSGGAGIQADLKSIAANGAYAATVITALTAQNTCGVRDVFPSSLDSIEAQFQAIVEDIQFDAVKVGMLFSKEIVSLIADLIKRHKFSNVVIDPVMVSTSGHKLLTSEAISYIKEKLLPLSRLITPNIPEAEMLLSKKLRSKNEIAEATIELADLYKTSILLKAGHMYGQLLTDFLFHFPENKLYSFENNRIDTKNTHGTGCTLSSAIAAQLARGLSIPKSVCESIRYLNGAIREASFYEIGKGHGPVHHFYEFW